MSLAWYLTVAALLAFACLLAWLIKREVELYLRGRYVYGENAPIPTKTFGQRAKPARPDGTSNRYAGGTER